jgi:SAM-dependent methyltransferase
MGSLQNIKGTIAAPPDPFMVTRRSHDRVADLIAAAGNDATILNVGAGFTDLAPNVINIDIFDSGTTDLIASAMALPIPDATADLVILQGVLEHVQDAAGTIAESIRVMKPGAIFYTEMPFLQPYHESPIDLRRSTKSGLATLCAPLIEIESGIHIGPAATFTWLTREFLARLISCGRPRVYAKASSIIGWLLFPFRYADQVFERLPHLHTVASSCYYVGRKDSSGSHLAKS